MERKYYFAVLMVGFSVMAYGLPAADDLSGKFFSPTFPLLANFYANDFLPFGFIVFGTIGAYIGGFNLGFIKGLRRRNLIRFGAIIILLYFCVRLSTYLTFSHNEDYNILGGLTTAWTSSLWMGMLAMFAADLFEPIFPKSSSEPN